MKPISLLFVLVFVIPFLGCESPTHPQQAPQPDFSTYTLEGYVNSVWKAPDPNRGYDQPDTIVGFQKADGTMVNLGFPGVEPRLSKDMHVRIQIRHLPARFPSPGNETLSVNDQPIYEIQSVQLLH